MKILYVGHFLDGTGYSAASNDLALALDAAGADVVCRPFRLNDNKPEVPVRIRELIEKPAGGADAIVQHTLPHFMERHSGFGQNVALFAWETSNFRRSGWARRLNRMDRVIAINQEQAVACRLSGVTKPIHVVPHATDVRRFERSYATLPELQSLRDDGVFLFYFVGEAVRRKGLAALLTAYHTEFRRGEKTRLVIKTSLPGQSPDACLKQVQALSDDVKKALRFQPRMCQQELLITHRLGDAEMMALHTSCDCFVAASCGEAWGIPSFDAMAMGKTPIAPRSGGFTSYLDGSVGTLVATRPSPCFAVNDAPPGLYTGQEDWASPDISELRAAMRAAFERKESVRKEMGARGLLRAYDFSHEAVGRLFLKALIDHEPATVDGPA